MFLIKPFPVLLFLKKVILYLPCFSLPKELWQQPRKLSHINGLQRKIRSSIFYFFQFRLCSTILLSLKVHNILPRCGNIEALFFFHPSRFIKLSEILILLALKDVLFSSLHPNDFHQTLQTIDIISFELCSKSLKVPIFFFLVFFLTHTVFWV